LKLIVSRQALADIGRLREFLSERDRRASVRAIAALDTAIRSLELFPGRGHPSGIPGVRELFVPFGKSAYLLRYAHFPALDTLVVIRVWHGRESRD
jgi:toxin ParE1/3/4